MKKTKLVGFSLDELTSEILKTLSEKTGIPKSALVRRAIRLFAYTKEASKLMELHEKEKSAGEIFAEKRNFAVLEDGTLPSLFGNNFQAEAEATDTADLVVSAREQDVEADEVD